MYSISQAMSAHSRRRALQPNILAGPLSRHWQLRLKEAATSGRLTKGIFPFFGGYPLFRRAIPGFVWNIPLAIYMGISSIQVQGMGYPTGYLV